MDGFDWMNWDKPITPNTKKETPQSPTIPPYKMETTLEEETSIPTKMKRTPITAQGCCTPLNTSDESDTEQETRNHSSINTSCRSFKTILPDISSLGFSDTDDTGDEDDSSTHSLSDLDLANQVKALMVAAAMVAL